MDDNEQKNSSTEIKRTEQAIAGFNREVDQIQEEKRLLEEKVKSGEGETIFKEQPANRNNILQREPVGEIATKEEEIDDRDSVMSAPIITEFQQEADDQVVNKKYILKSGEVELAVDIGWQKIKKLTGKQIRFVEAYFANGFDGTNAYLSVYHAKSHESAYRESYDLLRRPQVKAAIDKLQNEIRKSEQIKRADIVLNLNRISKMALEAGNPNLALKCYDMLNKLAGFYAPQNYNAVQINNGSGNEVKFGFGTGGSVFDPDGPTEEENQQNDENL